MDLRSVRSLRVGALGAAVTFLVAACGTSSSSKKSVDPQLEQRLQSAIEKTEHVNGYGLTYSVTSDDPNGGDADVLACVGVRQEPTTAAHPEDRLDLFVYGTGVGSSEPGRCQAGDVDDHEAIMLGTTLYAWKSAYGQSATPCKGGWDVWTMTPAVAEQVRQDARNRASVDSMALLATTTSIESTGDTLVAHLDPAKAIKVLPRTSTDAPTPDTIKVPLVEQCALVLSKVRCRLTTFNLLRPRFDLTVIRFGTCGRKMTQNLPVEIQIETPQLSD